MPSSGDEQVGRVHFPVSVLQDNFLFICFKSIFFKLEDNCFTVLCWFLPYITMNQP